MSELVHSNPDSFEDEQNDDSYDYEDDSYDYDDDYDSDDYDDYDDDDDDDDYYYTEYEEEHYGEERIDFDEEELTLDEIPLPEEILERYPFLKELPHGIAVIGGVARSIAREITTGQREPIRDIDLVNITDEDGNSEVDDETLETLSQKFMPDDYAFGHGIGDDTIDHYFKSRDFTINQCLIANGKLIISNLAQNDFQENIIRPTYFEHPYDGDDVRSRLFLKALMMRSVLLQISDSIPLIEDMQLPEDIIPFDIALFLNKAMSRGAETACIFTENLADWDIISEEYAGRPIALAKLLLRHVYAFEFRPSTDERFRDVQECEDMDGFFIPPAMSRYHASDPTVRRAIEEYEDDTGVSFADGSERASGHYTQAEYDEINRYSTDR